LTRAECEENSSGNRPDAPSPCAEVVDSLPLLFRVRDTGGRRCRGSRWLHPRCRNSRQRVPADPDSAVVSSRHPCRLRGQILLAWRARSSDRSSSVL